MRNIIVIILIVLALVGLYYFISQPEEKGQEQATFIQGSLGYPSEGIPEDMSVCAQDISSKERHCTDKQIQDEQFQYGKGYQITVPAGQYIVFAQVDNYSSLGYYSEFVNCGMKKGCQSHKPIIVEIEEGKQIKDIDPQDFYYQNSLGDFDFQEKGNLVLEDGLWYLLYEEPGQPALKKQLRFIEGSVCDFEGKKGLCLAPHKDILKEGLRVEIEGKQTNGALVVYDLSILEN